jgi:surfeit locus 1 family protein
VTARQREAVLVVVALAAAAVCVRLGVWQLDRLAQRRARNAVIAAARERPPLALPAPGVSPDSLADRRVVARGVYDGRYQRAWRPRMHQGTPGASLLAPLRLADGSGVLVDRGWVEAVTGEALARAAPPLPEGPVTVEGYAVRGPRGPGDVDPRALADTLPYPLLPVVVQVTPAPDARAIRLVRLPPPPLDDGPHRTYAAQWFSFAVIVLVGTALLVRRERRTAQRRRSIGT